MCEFHLNNKQPLKQNKIMEELSLAIVGVHQIATGYGLANGRICCHIFAQVVGSPAIVPGTAPFTVKVFSVVNNVKSLYRTITDIPVCLDPPNLNVNPLAGPVTDFNCIIENLPTGKYRLEIFDSTIPEPLDCRINSDWDITQPPFITLHGTVSPNGLPTMVSFEFGTAIPCDRIAEVGLLDGINPVDVSLCLKSAAEGSTNPVEYLLPGTLYYFRVKAENPLGVNFGDYLTATTPTYTSAPLAITKPATEIS